MTVPSSAREAVARDGAVTAADDWGGPGRRKDVHPARPGGYEELLHEVSAPNLLVLLDGEVREHLRVPRLERAMGVIYRPRTARMSHYFQSRLAEQFDAVVHLDRTTAVEPLEPDAGWDGDEVPATFPMQV